jgi:hypothetical protein
MRHALHAVLSLAGKLIRREHAGAAAFLLGVLVLANEIRGAVVVLQIWSVLFR